MIVSIPKKDFTDRHLKMLPAIASICAIKIKSVRDNGELIEKQDKLFQLKEEMLELKLKKLNSQLNPHFVFNSLNGIQYFITTENTKLALDYFSTFSRLVRFYLKELGKDTVSLNNEIDMLHWYLELQKLRYDDSFEYSISIEKKSGDLKETIIPSFVILVFENLVEQSNINKMVLQIQYHCKSKEQNIAPKNEYRKEITKWEDQVELLNTVENHGIQHNTSSAFDKRTQTKSIIIELPNLA